MNPLSGDLTFVDASGWIALVNANDTLHQQSVRLFQQRLNEGRGFVTSSVVLLEVGNWLSPVPLRRLAGGLMERIEHSTRVQVVELTPELYRKGSH
jgi:predicted nucleic acid-binding protein